MRIFLCLLSMTGSLLADEIRQTNWDSGSGVAASSNLLSESGFDSSSGNLLHESAGALVGVQIVGTIGGARYAVTPIRGVQTGRDYYDPGSASGHPVNPVPAAFTYQDWFYRNQLTGVLSWMRIIHADATSGSANMQSDHVINSLSPAVVEVSDDNGELTLTDFDVTLSNNSDGGSIGFADSEFSIDGTLQSFSGSITTVIAHLDAVGTTVPYDFANAPVSYGYNATLEGAVRSAIFDVGQSRTWDQLELDSMASAGSSAEVYLRTASSQGAIAAEPWVGPFFDGDSLSMLPANQFIQYEIRLNMQDPAVPLSEEPRVEIFEIAIVFDSDGDGVVDSADVAPADPNRCRDVDMDTCDDCTISGANGSGGEPGNDGTDIDGDGLCDAGDFCTGNNASGDTDGDGICDSLDEDSDNDGVNDVDDSAPTNANVCRDLDMDGCDDCSISGADQSGGQIDNDGPDGDNDGICDVTDMCVGDDASGDTDSDGDCDDVDEDDDNDGVIDTQDPVSTDPNQCGDSDSDMCDDCTNGIDGFGPLSDVSVGADGTDTDSDGLCDAGDMDDDNDGVNDDVDSAPLDPNLCIDSDNDSCDDCAIGTDDFGGLADNDPDNDGIDEDGDGLCDAGDPCLMDVMNSCTQDDDGDGVLNGVDLDPADPNVCLDSDADGCDDCTNTGANGSGGDPLNDGADLDGDGVCDVGDGDDDGDGVSDLVDQDPTDPMICRDSDNDGCDDCTNTGADGSGGDTSDDGEDTDSDGLCDVGDPDDDNDGIEDGRDIAGTDPFSCQDVDLDGCDDCAVGVDQFGSAPDNNPANDGTDDDMDGLCNVSDPCPLDATNACITDTDGDGVADVMDGNPSDPNICLDRDGDGCDDCALTGADGSGGDPSNDGLDTDGDDICDSGDTDDDNDGVVDFLDTDTLDPDVCGDVDGDLCDDCTIGTDNFGLNSDSTPGNDGVDGDGDGLCDLGDPCIADPSNACASDSDNDGVLDGQDSDPLDPNVCRDLDADGCDDCVMTGADGSGGDVLNDGSDTDGDGLCNAGDPDDDNDGVLDGLDRESLDPDVCGDIDLDTCEDCSVGTDDFGPDSDQLPRNDGMDSDNDGLCDVGDPCPNDLTNSCPDATDSDGDGVADGVDSDPGEPLICRDVDLDGCDDCSVSGADGSGGDPLTDGPDTDMDGICDAGDRCPEDPMDLCDGDRDGDGVIDDEDLDPLDPNVCRDLDGDSCDDCSMSGADGSGGDIANDGADLDGDGLCDAGDPDRNGDGFADDLGTSGGGCHASSGLTVTFLLCSGIYLIGRRRKGLHHL